MWRGGHAVYKIERETGKWSPPRPSERDSGMVNLEPSENLWANDVLEELDAEYLQELLERILRDCNNETNPV